MFNFFPLLIDRLGRNYSNTNAHMLRYAEKKNERNKFYYELKGRTICEQESTSRKIEPSEAMKIVARKKAEK